ALTVDTTGPDVPQVGSEPPTLASTGSATFVVTAEPGATFECRLDGGAWQACTMPLTLEQLADGPHTPSVVAIDPSGNRWARIARTWTVDTTIPEAPPVMSGPPTTTRSGGARFDISSEPGSSLECSVDGAAFAPCTSPIVIDGLAAGGHTLLVRQI